MDFPAHQAGLAKNHIILTINRRRVKNQTEMRVAIQHDEDALLIKLLCDERMLFLVIR